MRKTGKALKIIIPILMIIAGVVLCVAAVDMGISFSGLNFSNRTKNISLTFEEFSSVKMELDVARVDIVATEKETPYLECKNINTDLLECDVDEDSVLYIMHRDEGFTDSSMLNTVNISFGFNIDNASSFTLYLPKDKNLSELEILCGVGEIRADPEDSVIIGSLKADLGVGELDFSGLNTVNAAVEVGVGDLSYSGMIAADAGFNCGIGGVELELEGDYSKHSLDVQCGLGDKSIEFADTSFKGTDYAITVECGIGDVEIECN